MATSYPKDRFDDIPKDLERVGAHRAPRKRGRGWIAFGWAALATVVLVVTGAVGHHAAEQRAGLGSRRHRAPTDDGSATATAEPDAVDPTLSITVLNGTTTAGLAGRGRRHAARPGWTVGATSNAEQAGLTDTVVYYADPTLEGAARGLAAAPPGRRRRALAGLRGAGAQLVVVVGTDYEPPASRDARTSRRLCATPTVIESLSICDKKQLPTLVVPSISVISGLGRSFSATSGDGRWTQFTAAGPVQAMGRCCE